MATTGVRPGSWAQVEAEAGELAAAVRTSFAVRKHCTMATLRADGAPRISGTEVQFEDGELWLGSMPGARKALDLLRDGRVAVHAPTDDPPEGDESSWPGEAKVAGIAVDVSGGEAGGGEAGGGEGGGGSGGGGEGSGAGGSPTDSSATEAQPRPHRFRIDLREVVHTRVAPSGDKLLITSWHAGRGVQQRERA